MKSYVKARIQFGVVVVAIAATVCGVVYLFTLVGNDQEKWESWCRDNGGQVTKDSQTHVGTGFANGKPVTTVSVSTTYYCIADGKLLGVRS